MATQITLMSAVDSLEITDEQKEELKKQLEPPKKRIRYDRPNYLNFYTLYQYDRNKFRELLREWLKTDEAYTEKSKSLESWLIVLKNKQDEILEDCFIRDNHGNKLKDSDEKHIFRYKTLFELQRAIYDKIQWEFIHTGSIFIIDELNLSYEDKTAEIKGTEWKMPIKERVIIHIGLLRLLRSGLSIKEGLCQLNATKETIGNTATKTKN